MYNLQNIDINSKTYDWRMISLSATINTGAGDFSFTPVGVTAITYEQTRESQWNYGIGGRAISKGFGNTTATASITMAAFELEKLKNDMSGSTVTEGEDSRFIQNIPMFDLKVTYNFDDGTTKTDIIKNCSFNTDSAGASQNDMFIQATIDLDPAEIQFGIV